jgi:hypothetical protein
VHSRPKGIGNWWGMMSQGIETAIQGGFLVTPEGVIEGDLGIVDGVIVSVGTPILSKRRLDRLRWEGRPRSFPLLRRRTGRP